MNRSLLIFAGGRATRLGGQNKALLEVGGRTIVRRLLDELAPLAEERLLLTNDDTLAEIPGARLILDREPYAGVLPALANALEAAAADTCLAVACDMPFASRRVFEHLIGLLDAESLDVAIPHVGGFLEPMHAAYRREPVLRAIRAALARGEKRMVSYFDAVRVHEVAGDEIEALDPTRRAFFNVNTPEDLAEAQRLA